MLHALDRIGDRRAGLLHSPPRSSSPRTLGVNSPLPKRDNVDDAGLQLRGEAEEFARLFLCVVRSPGVELF